MTKPNQSFRILGIDPGTGICGFGVIEINKKTNQTALVDAGVITTPAHTSLEDRLIEIYHGLKTIIKSTNPDLVSIEKLFFTKNITTGISVAEARGVCLLVARLENLPIFEYTPNEIKKIITGYGNATKSQIQEMVRIHLNLPTVPKPDDAADALATAIVHSLTINMV